jgi:hypothetical protein
VRQLHHVSVLPDRLRRVLRRRLPGLLRQRHVLRRGVVLRLVRGVIAI